MKSLPTTVTFKVGTQKMGTADLEESGGVLTGTLTDVALLETVLGQMAPGSHTVTAVFNGVDTDHFVVTNPTTTLTITKSCRVTYHRIILCVNTIDKREYRTSDADGHDSGYHRS